MSRGSGLGGLACLALSSSLAVALLGCTPPLAESAAVGEGWPDLADPPVGRLDGRSDAALIIVIDDPAVAGRPGAWEVGSGWWRYLVRTRGLRRSRVRLLRNAEASATAIADGIRRMKEQSGAGSMLWLIYIGGGESEPDNDSGWLRTGDGVDLEFAQLRRPLEVGYHQSAFMLLDACPNEAVLGAGRVPGIPATPAQMRGLPPPLQAVPYHPDNQGFGMGAALAGANQRIDKDIERERATPRNTFLVTAGAGDRCASQLGGVAWPALAYAGLAGLQGWADIDRNGWVAARELSIYAQALIADGDPAVVLEAAGVDLMLADVAGFAPHPARVARRRRWTPAPDPGLARRSEPVLRAAEQVVVMELEDMVAVPRGEFFMGCDRELDGGCEADEYPAHDVMLGGFAIDRTEVTWAEYRACVASQSCGPTRLEVCWVWNGDAFVRGDELPPEMLADDHPVVCVNWPEAARYCEAMGKRLPTEAEWERAARGVDGRLYPWGSEAPSCKTAVMDGCSDFTRPVATHPAGASPVGALDMAGNASEWVYDWWDERSYPRRVVDDPTGPAQGQVRGVRGGSFYNSDADLRVSYRYGLEPTARTSIVGFRCAR